MSAADPGMPDPVEVERLKLRQIIADMDLKREQLQEIIAGKDARGDQPRQVIADIDAKRAQAVYEPRKFVLQAITTAAALVAAGVALGAFLVRGG